MAEISDQELATLRGGMQLLQTLNADPKSRKHLEAAIKIKQPDVETEDDVASRIAAPYVAQIDELKTTMQARFDAEDARRKERDEARQQDEFNAAFGKLRAAGYTDEGLEKIKGLMVDRKIADPEAAAAYFDKLNPPVQIGGSGFSPPQWDVTSTTGAPTVDTKALFTNEERWADNEAAAVLTELRTKQAG